MKQKMLTTPTRNILAVSPICGGRKEIIVLITAVITSFRVGTCVFKPMGAFCLLYLE